MENTNTKTVEAENPLGVEPVKKLLMQFAIPAVVAMLVNSLYNIVDQIFIGQGVGYLGNAATTVAFPIVTIVLAIGTLLGSGGSAYASIKLGEKKGHLAEKTLSNMFVLLTVIGVILAAIGLIFLEPILRLFGATDNVMPYAKDYSSIILIGVPFMMLGVGLSNMARTDGNPKLSMISMIIGAVLNTILDPIYIFVFNWGVKGAAIATITSQILSAVVLIWYFAKKGKMRFKKADMKIDFQLSKAFIVLGVSSCITQIAATILQVILNNSLVHYGDQSAVGGDVALSAMGIVLKVSAILISINIGIGVGSQPILGYNMGARKPKRIMQTFKLASITATVVSIIGWVACVFTPEILLSIFGSEDAQFTTFAVKCMMIYMFGIFCSGFQIVSTSYFQSTGQPLKASVLSMLRQLLLLIPLVIILPLFFGIDGILFAGPIADISAGIVVSIFVIKEMKRLRGWIAEDEKNSKDKAIKTCKNAV